MTAPANKSMSIQELASWCQGRSRPTPTLREDTAGFAPAQNLPWVVSPWPPHSSQSAQSPVCRHL